MFGEAASPVADSVSDTIAPSCSSFPRPYRSRTRASPTSPAGTRHTKRPSWASNSGEIRSQRPPSNASSSSTSSVPVGSRDHSIVIASPARALWADKRSALFARAASGIARSRSASRIRVRRGMGRGEDHSRAALTRASRLPRERPTPAVRMGRTCPRKRRRADSLSQAGAWVGAAADGGKPGDFPCMPSSLWKDPDRGASLCYVRSLSTSAAYPISGASPLLDTARLIFMGVFTHTERRACGSERTEPLRPGISLADTSEGTLRMDSRA